MLQLTPDGVRDRGGVVVDMCDMFVVQPSLLSAADVHDRRAQVRAFLDAG